MLQSKALRPHRTSGSATRCHRVPDGQERRQPWLQAVGTSPGVWGRRSEGHGSRGPGGARAAQDSRASQSQETRGAWRGVPQHPVPRGTDVSPSSRPQASAPARPRHSTLKAVSHLSVLSAVGPRRAGTQGRAGPRVRARLCGVSRAWGKAVTSGTERA